MHVAALPVSLRKHFADRPFQPGMIVTDGEDYASQTASFKSQKKVFPAGRALAIGHLHAEHLAPALPINADGQQHRSRADHRVLSELLIPRVYNQIGILTL